MKKEQTFLIIGALILSILFFIISIVWTVIKLRRNKKSLDNNKSGMSFALVFSLFILISIWLLRFAVGYFSIVTSKCGKEQLTLLEELMNSFFKALRTFGIEEEYYDYVISIKAMIKGIIPNSHWSFFTIQVATIVYATVLNLIAPIIGGTIILEILAKIFPKIGLRISYFFIRRPKYFFSELNPASLSLAKSIYNKEKTKKPILIFTDTYVDDENEKEYELLLEAKKYGAICIRDDLAHVSKTKRGKRSYFLIDENEFGNLQTLMGLTENRNIKYISGDAYIYLFVQSDAYVQVEKQINEEFKKEEKTKLLKNKKMPTIIPINGYRNLVQNLFVDIPLYEPLINKKEDQTKLNVTILGNGIIGTEAFLNAYWFGQMMISGEENGEKTMTECEMTINVVSKDSETDFWSKIDYINPEIKDTVQVLDSSVGSGNKELLCYDDKGNKNNPYCLVRYIKADVKVGCFGNSDLNQLLDSDYFIVALGNDADNISVANKLCRTIGKKHMDSSSDAENTVIAYAVFNSSIAEKLNGKNHHKIRNNNIYMHAFGSLDSVYSCDNVDMSRYKLLAEVIGVSYDKSQINKRLKDDNDNRKDDENNNYNYWSNMARAMHIKYKVFSLGLIKKSIFDFNSDKAKANKYINDKCKKYIQMALSGTSKKSKDKVFEDAQQKKHVLAWLEHRRWNAFTRTMGYQHINAKNVFDVKNRQKDMELKLHSCLVEARCPQLKKDDTYIYAEFMKNGLVDVNTMCKSFETKQLDRLDQVSSERKKRNPTELVEDFKTNDYFRYEFFSYLSNNDIDQLLNQIEIGG